MRCQKNFGLSGEMGYLTAPTANFRGAVKTRLVGTKKRFAEGKKKGVKNE